MYQQPLLNDYFLYSELLAVASSPTVSLPLQYDHLTHVHISTELSYPTLYTHLDGVDEQVSATLRCAFAILTKLNSAIVSKQHRHVDATRNKAFISQLLEEHSAVYTKCPC